MPTIIKYLSRSSPTIRYRSETGNIISYYTFDTVTAGTVLGQHIQELGLNICTIHFYSLGTYMYKCGNFHNKKKLILYPYTVFIWRKNFIAYGWIKGYVNLFVKKVTSCVYRSRRVYYTNWEVIGQFHGLGPVITLLRESNWQEAVKLITNNARNRRNILKAMMEE